MGLPSFEVAKEEDPRGGDAGGVSCGWAGRSAWGEKNEEGDDFWGCLGHLMGHPCSPGSRVVVRGAARVQGPFIQCGTHLIT